MYNIKAFIKNQKCLKSKLAILILLVALFLFIFICVTKKEDIQTCFLSEYGAVGDGQTLNTKAFKKAIKECKKIIVREGVYKTGAIKLDDYSELHIEKGAEILFSEDKKEYPLEWTRWAGLDVINYSPFIYAKDCKNIKITGKGKINGNGAKWQEMIEKQKKEVRELYKMSFAEVPIKERVFKDSNLRPSLIQPYNCKGVLIEGVEIIEGAMWMVHPVYSEDIIIKDITITATGSNTDGIVIDSSKNVLIENVKITSGDDAIAIKSGRDNDGWMQGKSSENITIRNVEVYKAHGGITIGSEMSGDVRNVNLENMTIFQADRGIRLKTLIGRGGIIENIHIKDVTIKNVIKESINLDMDYGSSTMKPKTDKKPLINNIIIENVHVEKSSPKTIVVTGIDGQMSNILFKNIFTDDEKFIKIKNGKGVSLEGSMPRQEE